MIDLSNITLVSVDGVDPEKTVNALNFSCKNIKFNKNVLITYKKPNNLTDNIELNLIEKLNWVGYNKFIIYDLKNYIETEYCLVIQTDGFVLNPESWRDEFYDYDYIGAPFPSPRWKGEFIDRKGKVFRVGNGGFSFRTKKLLETPTKLNLKWEPFKGHYNEDGFLCANNRHILEDDGIKFAPLNVAKYFSHETTIPEIVGIKPFGFHKWNGQNKNYPKL